MQIFVGIQAERLLLRAHLSSQCFLSTALLLFSIPSYYVATTNTMAASLNKLPCELLQMIVDGAEDQRDKLSLAICCSHVHQEVLPNCHISLKLKRPSHIVLRRVLKLSYCNSRVGRAVWDLHLEGWPKSYTSKEPLRATGSSTEKDIHFYASQ